MDREEARKKMECKKKARGARSREGWCKHIDSVGSTHSTRNTHNDVPWSVHS